MTDSRERIVLAYSGNLATSAAIRWIAETRGAEVVTLTLDLGAGGELQEIHERALSIGAVRAHVIDVREEFADDYLLPALQAGALNPGLETPESLARPLIARRLVEVARIERAAALAHGGPAGSELDVLLRAIDPAATILTPETFDAAEFARRHNIVVPAATLRKMRAATPDNGADVEITFDRDVPLAINGVPMSLTELIESLTVIAAQHGISGASEFAGAPAIGVLQAAFDARQRGETCVVRLRLQHGATTAMLQTGSELAAGDRLTARRS
jgi:argininosuccinate synthase